MKVLLFARLREALGEDSLILPPDVQPQNVAELREWLLAKAPAELAEAMADPNVFCAVNQHVVDTDHPLTEGDEIAFFPPVTGG